MILIQTNRAGAMWLRAMFRFYCRKYNCDFVQESKERYHAEGERGKKAEYKYEIAHAQLQIRIIDALAKNGADPRTIINATTRQFVKELYGRV